MAQLSFQIQFDEDKLRELVEEKVTELKAEGWLYKDDFEGLVKKQVVIDKLQHLAQHVSLGCNNEELLLGIIAIVKQLPDYSPLKPVSNGGNDNGE